MRIQNSIKNMITGVIGYLVMQLFSFIVRIVFVRTLGENYLGIDGLFYNIIVILSISELGIGTAIVFNLYKPLAENDKELIKAYMALYKKCYLAIALIILVLGTIIAPLLPYIIKNKPDIPESLYLIYFMLIGNTVLSYLFTYKSSLIVANQHLSIINIYTVTIKLLTNILQIIALCVFRNYILFLLIMLCSTLLINVTLSIKCDKMYPYLKEASIPLQKSAVNTLLDNIKAMFLFKVSDNVMNGTTSIIISAFVGINMVGRYSNYLVVINAISVIITKLTDGITASIGNFHATESKKRSQELFEINNFANFWLYGFSSVCFFVMLPHFIPLAFGREYLLDIWTMAALIVLFYIVGILYPVSMYRYATGLFMRGRIRAIVLPVLSVLLSILLVKPLGLTGIFLGIILARLISQMWYDPLVVYKYDFETSISKFYIRNVLYIVTTVFAAVLSELFCSLLSDHGIGILIMKLVICAVASNLIFLMVFLRTKEFKYLKNIFVKIMKKYLGSMRHV